MICRRKQNAGRVSRRAFVIAPLAAGAAASLAQQPAASSSATDLQHTLSAADRLDIYDLFARYAWAYDCSDVDAFVANFTPDGVVAGFGREHRGRDAIRRWIENLIAMREEQGDDWLHDAYHHRFAGDKRACTVYSYATHFYSWRPDRRHGIYGTGYFVSRCVKIDGIWYFARHEIHAWDRRTLPWKEQTEGKGGA